MFNRHDNVVITAISNPANSWAVGKSAQISKVVPTRVGDVYVVMVVRRNRIEQLVVGRDQMRKA